MTEPTPPPHEPDPLEPVADRSDDAPRPTEPAPAGDGHDPKGPNASGDLPLDPIDEAASAIVDGLPIDGAASSIDPAELDERVQRLSAVRSRLAEPIAIPEPSVVDAQ